MRGAEGRSRSELADEVRRQFESPAMRRYYQSHPLFQADDRTPDYLDDLLLRLDEASEQRQRQG